MRRDLGFILISGLLGIFGCDREETRSVYPAAEVFAQPVNFGGSWIGEAGRIAGELKIDRLGNDRYYGRYSSDDGTVDYVLDMQHVEGPGPDGTPTASNLVKMSWQDGRGDQGQGWMLINREDSALSGSFGRGEQTDGLGQWTFIRLE